MAGYLLLYNLSNGLVFVSKTEQNEPRDGQDNFYKDGIKAHLKAKEIMDAYTNDLMNRQMEQFRENKKIVEEDK